VTNSDSKVGENVIPSRTGKPIPKEKRATSLQFLVERIDGVSTVQELAWMNGIPVAKLRRELGELVELGVVEVAGSQPDMNSRITTRSDIIDLNKLEEVESSFESAVQSGASEERPQTREVTRGEQEEQAEILEENSQSEARAAEFEKKPEPRLPVPENWPSDFSAFELSGDWNRYRKDVDPDLLRLLVFYLTHLGEVTYYQLLQVPRDASMERIEAMTGNLVTVFRPQAWSKSGEATLEKAASRVHKAIRQAANVLTDQESREGYDMALQHLDAEG
jgi:hypothetical protein